MRLVLTAKIARIKRKMPSAANYASRSPQLLQFLPWVFAVASSLADRVRAEGIDSLSVPKVENRFDQNRGVAQ